MIRSACRPQRHTSGQAGEDAARRYLVAGVDDHQRCDRICVLSEIGRWFARDGVRRRAWRKDAHVSVGVVRIDEIGSVVLADAKNDEGFERGRRDADVDIRGELQIFRARIRQPSCLGKRARWKGRAVREHRFEVKVVADLDEIRGQRAHQLACAVRVNEPHLERRRQSGRNMHPRDSLWPALPPTIDKTSGPRPFDVPAKFVHRGEAGPQCPNLLPGKEF